MRLPVPLLRTRADDSRCQPEVTSPVPRCDTAIPTVPQSCGSATYLHPIPSTGLTALTSPSSAIVRSRTNSIWCPAGFPLWLTDSGVCHIQAHIRQNRRRNVPKSPEESTCLIANCSSRALNLTIKMAGARPLKTSSLGGEIKIKESQQSWKKRCSVGSFSGGRSTWRTPTHRPQRGAASCLKGGREEAKVGEL